MSNKEVDIKNQIDAFCRMAVLISVADAQYLVNEINHTESFMPILDPTGWMKISKNINGHKNIAVAFLTFRTALEGELERRLT